MTTPAKPEQKDPKIGTSNPAESLWEDSKVQIGPPADGQPRKGGASDAAPTAPVITGQPKR